MGKPRVHLLGVPIDPVTREEACDRLLEFLRSGSQHHVMTPNNEMIVQAQKHPLFMSVLQSTSLNIPDSTGVVLGARVLGSHLPERVTGVDTVLRIADRLTPDLRVFLLGAAPGVAEEAARILSLRNAQLTIVGAYAGSPDAEEEASIVDRINTAAPHLLLVAFGSPEQDLWIHRVLHKLPSVRVAMGVGGTFDFLAGVQVRAPRWMRRIGLEWLWRLLRDPRRARRIAQALIVFPWLLLRSRGR